MRILLVKPKPRLAAIRGLGRFARLEPLELEYLAAAVPAKHEVRAIDLRFAGNERRTFERSLIHVQPDLVAFTGYSHEASVIKALVTMVKTHLPRTKTVVGGHHATVAANDYEVDGIDAIVRGEGTGPFRAIVDALDKGEKLAGIANVVVPGESNGDLSGFPPFPDPATMPTPRRDIFDHKRYSYAWVCEEPKAFQRLYPPTAIVRTSFGCTMTCNFCIVPYVFGGKHMPRPVEAVVDEIASLPVDHVYFADDENFINETFAWELAESLARRGVKKRYFAWTRATTVNRSPELFKRWREVGLDAAFLGFEYPTDQELREAQKGGSVAGNERAHTTLRSLGIAVHAAFMLKPEYTEEDFARLREYIKNMPPAQCSLTVCTPSPGTPGFEAIKDKIWVPNPYDLLDCMHPIVPTALPLRRFCELFSRQMVEAGLRTPLRVKPQPIWPPDLVRVYVANTLYNRAFRTMYRDYPRELWQ